MRDLVLYLIAPAVCLWFAQRAWRAALALARRDAKEAAALAVARKGGAYGRAYAAWNSYKRHLVTAGVPWRRPECM